jgi:UDP-N-acetylglucosamine 2-epimerase
VKIIEKVRKEDKLKILTVVGARPQFIKAAVVSLELRKLNTEILVHTGQHFDYNMSKQFFEELNIPDPDYNLGISGGSHGQMTGKMLIEIEKVLIKEQPDWLLVYGDTNSTLAAALAAAKLHIPICHVESGTRTHSMTNPEEINRICTDHVSSMLLACTENDIKELEREGLSENAQLVGDPMYDAFIKYTGRLSQKEINLILLDGCRSDVPERFYYLTCHREENTGIEKLTQICKAMEQLPYPVIYPVHPRNRKQVKYIQEKERFKNIIFTEPIGYLESICLVNYAEKIITDSGGLQREAFFAGKQCVTVLNHVTWQATMVDRRNQLARPDCDDILDKLSKEQEINESYKPFGDGHAAKYIAKALKGEIKGGMA